MRTEMSLQETLDFGSTSSLKVVQEWQEKCLATDGLLSENGRIIRQAHEDFRKCLSESMNGRKSKYSTD